MRVITGSARGRKLDTPTGLNTRPTAEKVKEAIFSAVQFDIEGASVLDLFAGSGQLGIEALSRGARQAVFVESDRSACAIIQNNLAKTGFASASKVLCADAQSYLKGAAGPFDIAYLDPPYREGLMLQTVGLLPPIMSERGIIICETAKKETLPDLEGFNPPKKYKYGITDVFIYRKPQADR